LTYLLLFITGEYHIVFSLVDNVNGNAIPCYVYSYIVCLF